MFADDVVLVTASEETLLGNLIIYQELEDVDKTKTQF